MSRYKDIGGGSVVRERHAANRDEVGVPEGSAEGLRDAPAEPLGTPSCPQVHDPIVGSHQEEFMTRMLPTQKQVSDFGKEFADGFLAIPEIQRDVVWKPDRVKELILSGFRG